MAAEQSSQNKMLSLHPTTAGPQLLDKKRLAEAVKLKNDGTSVEIASGRILVDELVFNAVTIAELGTIQVPVSLMVIQQMQENVEKYDYIICIILK